MSAKACLLLTLLCYITLAEGYKILVVFPMPGKSHGILGDGVVRHLLNAGHQVTYVTPFLENNSTSNLRRIDVSKNFEILSDKTTNIKEIIEKKMDINDYGLLFFFMNLITQSTLETKEVQNILKDPKENFDVVIAEWMFSDLYSSLGAIFNCPFIWVSTVEPHWMVTRLIDEALNPAYSSDCTSQNLPPYTFRQRLEELWIQIKAHYYLYAFKGHETQTYNEFLLPHIKARGTVPESFEDIRYNVSLMLGNSHVSMGGAVSLPQSYKPIGGYHIEDDVKPLPEDLKKLMDNAKNGVIYFSMGSNLLSKDIPDEMKRDLIKMFGSLKQTVLWKLEESIPDIPNNLHIIKWAPQQSVLSHPNCILFITHGGLLSTTEAIHFGVPIIGIPVFADQFNNVARAVVKGFAKKVVLSYTMANDLKVAIEEVTRNPRYNQKVKELSFIYHHRPVPPGRELVHWVEHVVATRGAPHLRSPALMVPWYQKIYLDLLALVIIVTSIFIIVIKRLVSTIAVGKKKKE